MWPSIEHDVERRQRPVREGALLAGPAAVACIPGMLAGGCTRNEKATPAPVIDGSLEKPPEIQTLRPVSLPAVSLATESAVREQMRERYSSLTLKMQNPSAPLELGNTYREMGCFSWRLLSTSTSLSPAFSMRRRSCRARDVGPTISGFQSRFDEITKLGCRELVAFDVGEELPLSIDDGGV